LQEDITSLKQKSCKNFKLIWGCNLQVTKSTTKKRHLKGQIIAVHVFFYKRNVYKHTEPEFW